MPKTTEEIADTMCKVGLHPDYFTYEVQVLRRDLTKIRWWSEEETDKIKQTLLNLYDGNLLTRKDIEELF